MALDAADGVVLVVLGQIGPRLEEDAGQLADRDGGGGDVILHAADIHAALIGYYPVARRPGPFMLLPAGFDFDAAELFTVPCHSVVLGARVGLGQFTYDFYFLYNYSYSWWKWYPGCFSVFEPSFLKARLQICRALRLLVKLGHKELFDCFLLGQLHFSTIEGQELVHVGIVGS